MKILIFVVSILVSFTIHAGIEHNPTLDVEAFNYFCTQSFGKSDDAILKLHGVAISEEYIQKDPILKSMNSKFSHVIYKNKNYMVTTTSEENKACSIVMNKMAPSALIKNISENFKAITHKVNENQHLKLETFLVQKNGVHKGALIAVMYSKPSSSNSRGSISYVPQVLVEVAHKKLHE